MKKIILLLVSLCIGVNVFGQYPEGTVKVDSLYSEVLENPAGENPTRSVHIYLPPGYENTNKRYPVIYFLHGFTDSNNRYYNEFQLNKLLDRAIATRKIRPVIVVTPNEYTIYRGSFYTNSSYTGNWADFTAKNLITYVDKTYRTIASKDSRGISGHSMGGYGATKLAMLYPDTFSSVYSLSGCMNLYKEIGANSYIYKRLQDVDSSEELVTGKKYFLENFLVAFGQAYSPNPNKPPFYADLPYYYINDSLVTDAKTIKKWSNNFLPNMVDDHVDNLKKLTAIKIDWGRNDQMDFVLLGCRELSQKLEDLGVNHYAEEYIGNHSNKLWTDNGRVLNDLLPFFDSYLEFE